MEMIIGYLLIIVGVGMEIISLLVWFGVLKPATNGVALRAASFWDVLLELAKRAQDKGVSAVVFDRGRFLYHGRVQAFP